MPTTMFETAELGRKISKSEFKDRELALRQELLTLQRELRSAGRFQVIVDFAGVDGAGKGSTVNILHKWMDTRWLTTEAYDEPLQSERERPEFWRFWRDLPPRGQIGLYLKGRYSRPFLARVYGKIDAAEFQRDLDRICAFEEILAADGALVLKFWMHLSRGAQKRRLKALEKDPLFSFRVKPEDWEHWEMYASFVTVAEQLIARTSTVHAPWHVVEGTDERYRSLAVGTILRDALREHVAAMQATDAARASLPPANGNGPEGDRSAPLTVFDGLDMSKRLKKSEYKRRLNEFQAELAVLQREMLTRGISTIVVFEGPDAAGKGGAIRRLIALLDARKYKVRQVAAPTDEEAAQHYLWRFWRQLPRAGHLRIFDRSWYGRVLVERVEGFASIAEWRRAYAEINDFERRLLEHGTVLVKYWIHITNEEQLARFRARETTPWKRWKLTDEDWRNREKWDDYRIAAHHMIERTSTHDSPWILVEGNDKNFARVRVLETLIEACRRRLDAA